MKYLMDAAAAVGILCLLPLLALVDFADWALDQIVTPLLRRIDVAGKVRGPWWSRS